MEENSIDLRGCAVLQSALRNLKFAIVLGAVLFVFCFAAQAQESGKTWKIGVLVSGTASVNAARDEALRAGLRQFG